MDTVTISKGLLIELLDIAERELETIELGMIGAQDSAEAEREVLDMQRQTKQALIVGHDMLMGDD
ncbi:hypothetical protein [Brevibacterium moorei]|uniref:hypothetical protein n=1 Tax=Brevibacterium moorei TaxID=2968457 RepID=UPI00211CBD25|nr:hypothetical protein [Brevibacterium sp. 68QC2CO]MCQ9385131.1 hypothetical protein [Brevibacterium sp. 68QC2CO]